MTFKVGDKVRIKNIKNSGYTGWPNYNPAMERCEGSICTICKVRMDFSVHKTVYFLYEVGHSWVEEWLEYAEPTENLFNG